MRVPCAHGNVLPDILADGYGEAPEKQGVANGALVQVWRNPETGSWTIVLVEPDGTVCALASGDGWMDAEPYKPAGDAT